MGRFMNELLRKKHKDNYNKFYNNLMKELKKNMKSMGYKQKDMADIIGMSLSVFGNKINNQNGKFNILELALICDELLMSIDELIYEGCI